MSLLSSHAWADVVIGTCTVQDPITTGTDCSGQDLTGLDFSGLDLSSANFDNADLTNAILDDADLTVATLSNATIANASFQNALLQDTSLVATIGTGVGVPIWGYTICFDSTISEQYTGNGCWGTFADDDNDGVNNDMDDLPNNVAASMDTDLDGYPDSWNNNPFFYCDIACQDTSGLHLDDFPSNVAASKDSDFDGYPDFWNEGCDATCQSTSGLELDKFPGNDAAYRDDDEDGFPDQWNGTCDLTCQSNSGLALDAGLHDAGAIFVDINTPTPYGSGADGLAWNTAWPNVADALQAASAGQEIWIAQGVYYPDEAAGGNTDLPADTFTLVNHVALLGGFDGTETMANQAIPEDHKVILSGDITQNDTNVDVNGVHTAYEGGGLHNDTNSHSIVEANSVNSRITGLIISGGGSGVISENDNGGGIYCSASKLTLERVKLFYNRANATGGAIYCSNTLGLHYLKLEEVHIEGSYAGSIGGGIFAGGGELWIGNSTISNNESAVAGGGIGQSDAETKIANSTIAFNSAPYAGGLYVAGGGALTTPFDLSLLFTTVAFNDATATGAGNYGGGLNLTNYANADAFGTVFVGNTSVEVGAENLYRHDTSEFEANYSSFGSGGTGGLFVEGLGSTTLANLLLGGANPSVNIPAQNISSMIDTTLTNHGGYTAVLPIPFGSVLLDIIPDNECSFVFQEGLKKEDQRGFPRSYFNDGGFCDIGAYERNDFDGDGSPDNIDTDIDGDGMPNSFEDSNGLDSFNPADISDDPDGDTLTNLQEYNLGTDPQVANASEPDANLSISPRYHRYGFESATCQSAATPVTYTVSNNHASQTVNIGAITLDFMGAGDWQLVTGQDNCSSNTIPAVSSCTFQVVYCTSAAGNKTGVVNVPTDDAQTSNLTSALFNFESDMDEAQRRLPPVLSDLVIRDSSLNEITNGQIKGGEQHSFEWTITGYHPSYDSLIAAFNCDSLTPGTCGDNFSSNYTASAMLSPGSFGAGTWTYNGIVANTYTYTANLTLPYNAAETNEWVLRFYRNSEQDVIVGNSSLSLLIPGNIMPSGTGYYDTSGRRINIQVVP